MLLKETDSNNVFQYTQITHEVDKTRLWISDGYGAQEKKGKEGKSMDVKEKGTYKLNHEGGKVGAKYHHDKQAQQVTTTDCGFANRALDDHSNPP